MDALAPALAHEKRITPRNGYCSALLLSLDRKNMETMAAHLVPDRTLAMLAAVRAQVLPDLLEHGPIRSWIADDTSMPKKGTDSVGAARQYCGQLGKVDNCQVLVTLSLATATAALPVAARLYLPERS